MYWYFKYPLYVLLALIMTGFLYLIWTRLPEDLRTRVRTEQETGVQKAADNGVKVVSDEGAISTPRSARIAELEMRLAAAENQLREDNLMAARTLAQKVIEHEGVQRFDRTWFRAAKVISAVNTVLINSDAPAPEKVAYIVQEGDNLVRIAHRHGTTVGAIQRFNDMDPTNPTIYPGNVLYILQCQWSIAVSKSHFSLLLLDGDKLFKLYPVGIGKQNRTPVGTFEIVNKVREPAWTPPGKNIPYGDPENVLGTHWLSIEPIEGTDPSLKGYGIHGTWEPQTIGTAASRGCVRMHNKDVSELFDLVPLGVRVTIAE